MSTAKKLARAWTTGRFREHFMDAPPEIISCCLDFFLCATTVMKYGGHEQTGLPQVRFYEKIHREEHPNACQRS
jgi:hypothetical protein